MSDPSRGEILLVVPPFQSVARPALGVSQLRANLREHGFATRVVYLNFRFAEAMGLDWYEWIADHTFHVLLGEFIFSTVVFRRTQGEVKQYVKDVLSSVDVADHLKHLYGEDNRALLINNWMRQAAVFCERAVEEICAHDCWLIGVTTSFQQNCASLALIKEIKRRRPDILTALGGANCQADMGDELFRQFPEIDYIGQGECDRSFVDLVRSLRDGGEGAGIPGVLSRKNGTRPPAVQPLRSKDLDELPYPDFSDYFAQLKNTPFSDRVAPGLVMETSRGCWWGAAHPCTFCGLNGEERAYRSKSASRVIREMEALVEQYRVRHVRMADNILDMQYFKTVLPALAERRIANIFYETKANLSKSQVKLLARSGVWWIQPGIESLSDQALQLMRKGTTKIQNIQLLKWCAEYGIWAGWNYLYGFPGEPEEEIAGIAEEIEALHHLKPPHRTSLIRIDRFSTYFTDPNKYKLEPIRPGRAYRHVYAFPEGSLKQIAYFYQSEAIERKRGGRAFKMLQDAVDGWQRAYPSSFLLAIPRRKSLIVIDTRPCSHRSYRRLKGVQRSVYEFCDKARTLSAIRNAHGTVADGDLEAILASFVRAKWMICSDGRYLSLAVVARSNCGKEARAAAGDVVGAPGGRRLGKRLGRLVTLRIPPRRIAAELARRARQAKARAVHKAVFHVTRLLSEAPPEDSLGEAQADP